MPRLLLVALLFISSAVHAQLLVKDDTGRSLVVRQHFKRIVTLAPFLTEAAYAAGAGDLVVAVDGLSDYPREATRLPKVATGAAFSIESIAAVRPDLVLAWKDGIRSGDVEALTGFGATVYLAQPRSLEDLPQLLNNIGALTGRNSQQAVTVYENRLKELRRANAAKPRLTVFVEIWSRPLTTVGGSSLLSEAVQVCRGENVFGMLAGSLPRVEYDEVAQANPYLILGVNSANNAEEFQANWMTHYNIPAVQASRLMYFESEALQRPTVRTLDSVARLCAEMDQVRLHNSLIAPSEAFTLPKGPVAAAASDQASDTLRRPMTSIERDVAAVLSSKYAIGKPATESAAQATATDAGPREALAIKQPAAAEAPARVAPAPASPPPTLAAAAAVANPSLKPARTLGNVAPAGAALARYTQVSRYGDLYFISGQIALDPESGTFNANAEVADQTRAALENIRRVLEAESLTMANIVSTTVYLRNINDLDAMDAAYETEFRTRFPARTVVEAANLPRGAKVQIEVIAGR